MDSSSSNNITKYDNFIMMNMSLRHNCKINIVLSNGSFMSGSTQELKYF